MTSAGIRLTIIRRRLESHRDEARSGAGGLVMRLFSVPISGLEEPTHEESCDCYRGSGRWPHLPRFGWQRVRWFAWWRLRQRAQLLCARADLLRPSAEVLQRAPLQEVALLQAGLRAEVRLRGLVRLLDLSDSPTSGPQSWTGDDDG